MRLASAVRLLPARTFPDLRSPFFSLGGGSANKADKERRAARRGADRATVTLSTPCSTTSRRRSTTSRATPSTTARATRGANRAHRSCARCPRRICRRRFASSTAPRRGLLQSPPSKSMTSAQHDAIARSKATLPHQILGVPSGIDEPTLRKAYRACAKLLHPDKCSLPEADAAFSSAHGTLEGAT